MKLSIIIPAYNEHDRIVYTLTQTLAYLKNRSYSAQILVVSDGSTDATGDVVRGFTAPAHVTVDFLEYFPNRGKGYAVKYGMLRGDGDVILFMDADYSVPMAAVERGLALLGSGCDIAIASRALSGSRVVHHQNPWRELSAKLYTLIQNTYLGFRYRDTQCGFKLFRREAARRLFGQQKLSSVIFDPEILWLASREGYRVGEFPVEWTHMEDSRIQYDSIGKSLFIFRELFRIRRLHRHGK